MTTRIRGARVLQDVLVCMQVPIDGDASLLTEDYLYNVFLFPVNKAAALAYLDAGGPVPARYAKVIAVRGAHSPPDVMEYKVNDTTIRSSRNE